MTSRPSERRAYHWEAVCVDEESDEDRSDGDQLARSSEVAPSYAPGVFSVMCSHCGVNPYGRRSTELPRSILLPRDCRTGEGSDGSAEVIASKHEGQASQHAPPGRHVVTGNHIVNGVHQSYRRKTIKVGRTVDVTDLCKAANAVRQRHWFYLWWFMFKAFEWFHL